MVIGYFTSSVHPNSADLQFRISDDNVEQVVGDSIYIHTVAQSL